MAATITKAFFVQNPRTIADLILPGNNVTEARFKIVQIVLLKAIDYENFITDLLADREFLTASPYCHVENDIWYCFSVLRKKMMTWMTITMILKTNCNQ